MSPDNNYVTSYAQRDHLGPVFVVHVCTVAVQCME